jgi:hypothetical protein
VVWLLRPAAFSYFYFIFYIERLTHRSPFCRLDSSGPTGHSLNPRAGRNPYAVPTPFLNDVPLARGVPMSVFERHFSRQVICLILFFKPEGWPQPYAVPTPFLNDMPLARGVPMSFFEQHASGVFIFIFYILYFIFYIETHSPLAIL